MIAFTILGFVADGEHFFDFNLDVFAESPVDAIDKVLKQQSNLVVSAVCRASCGRDTDY